MSISNQGDHDHHHGNGGVVGPRGSMVPRSMSLVPKFSMGPAAKANNKLVINVGGIRYETYKSTLKNIPDTRLSWLCETNVGNADFDPIAGEYFFDRHPGVFLMVLNYYRTGKLHAPSDVCGPLFEEELAFWGMDEKQIEPCCWMNYRTHRDAQETLAEFDGGDFEPSDSEDEPNIAVRFGIEEADEPDLTCWERFQPKLWLILEEPYSSKAAQVFAMISYLFVLLSIATLSMETHVMFRIPKNESIPHLNLTEAYLWSHSKKNELSSPHPALIWIEIVCIGYFTLEYILRLIFCPDRKKFFKQILNWVDLLSILPFYIEAIVLAIAGPGSESNAALQFLKSLRLIRIFRIFKLTRHFSGLNIVVHTMKASAKELILLIIFLLITVIIFACFIYYAEIVAEDDKNYFKSIPIGFWWAVVTMTTLGYGDMYPRTALGYLVGALCAIAGVLLIALPVPVIVNNFTLYYSHAQAKLKLPKKRKRILVGADNALKEDTMEDGMSDEGRSPSPNPSVLSVQNERKDSNESMADSIDSGIKTGGSSASGESTGISVIFTDEVADTPPVSRRVKTPPKSEKYKDDREKKPPRHRKSSLRIPNGHAHVHPEGGVDRGGCDADQSKRRGSFRPTVQRRQSLKPRTGKDLPDVDM